MTSFSPDLDQKYRATSIFTPFDRPRFHEGEDSDNKDENVITVGSKTDLEFPNLSYTSPLSSSLSVEIDSGAGRSNTVISSSSKYKAKQGKPLTAPKISSRNKDSPSLKLSSASTTVASTTTKLRSTQYAIY